MSWILVLSVGVLIISVYAGAGLFHIIVEMDRSPGHILILFIGIILFATGLAFTVG